MIELNIAISIEKYLQVYTNIIETTQLQMILVLLLILLIMVIVTCLIKKKTKKQIKKETMSHKMLK